MILKLLLWQDDLMEPARDENKEGKKYGSYRKKLYTLIVVVVVVIAGFAIYYTVANLPSKKLTLVIYTYDSLFTSGNNNTTQVYNAIFGNFEKMYNVTIDITKPTNGLLQQLNATRSHPQADIVIGLDNINGPQAVSDGLLMKHSSSAKPYINSSLYSEMGNAASYITPYEYSDLGIDYNTSFVQANFTPSMWNLANNSTIASNLLLENPLTDSYGQQFLVWEIALSKYVLGQNWTVWWKSIKQYLTGHIYPDWGHAFGNFETGAGTNLVVSSLTDPAYYYLFGYGNGTNSTVLYQKGTPYGWRTIYGLGIVNGSKNVALDKAFINYFLSPAVQKYIPEVEWNYPANSSQSLPNSYIHAPDQSKIVQLNEYMNASYVAQNVPQCDTEWLSIMQ